MNNKTLSIASVLFPIVLMSALAGYRWHNASSAQPKTTTVTLQPAGKSDMPMFGGSPTRNMVNLIDKNPPLVWSVEEGKQKNIKWAAEIGDKAYGGPVIADGKVFVGTNNKNPRDPKVKDSKKAVLMAFNEADGKFLWQITHDFPNHPAFDMARAEGLCSTPIVEEKRVYYTAPGCEVICADTSGKVLWTYDMMAELKVVPHHLGTCSPLIVGDLLMIITANGVDDEGKVINPKAPSFIALNKKTGKLKWQSNLPGKDIIEGQWSNPTLAIVNGKKQVIFAGGDCYLYGLEPETGEMIWKCNCNPLPKKKDDREMRPYIISTPVVDGDRVYVGLGIYPEHAQSLRSSHFLCIDITKKGDVSPKSYDAKAAINKNSALVWAFGGPIEPAPEKGRQVYFGKTISTAAVKDGLVYINEEAGYAHCLDAKTGQRYWDHDFKGSVWGSPYWVDGKIYVGTEDGDIVIFEHGKERKFYHEGKLQASKAYKDVRPAANMDDVFHGTPVVANGVLYIATRAKVYAIAARK